jgi:diguanylate cyclase (GGDEF)-like protein
MRTDKKFYQAILNTLNEHIAVLDKEGCIRYVNQPWINFSKNNHCLIRGNWHDVNYLNVCQEAGTCGDKFGSQAAQGIQAVIDGQSNHFYLEYPCHSPSEKRWFAMRVTPFIISGTAYYVVAHLNITERKIAEESVQALSRLDGLTNIANRRYFDLFLNEEWRRCVRLKQPISIAMIDIDHFKSLNDHYGHQYGDNCLKQLAQCLTKFCRRPTDLCARYGGEEFALVLSNTDNSHGQQLLKDIYSALEGLQIENTYSPVSKQLTISTGLATCYPKTSSKAEKLITLADQKLYQAKANGRNQMVC